MKLSRLTPGMEIIVHIVCIQIPREWVDRFTTGVIDVSDGWDGMPGDTAIVAVLGKMTTRCPPWAPQRNKFLL
ncbi:MAG: hypothetical protein AAFX99_13530, partial [Myxococcota bacterium]